MELLKVIFDIGDEGWESDGGQIVHSIFVGRGVSNGFSAEIGQFDGFEVFLVGFHCMKKLVRVHSGQCLDIPFAASLYNMKAPPVSICA